jgi:hypothetical protein
MLSKKSILKVALASFGIIVALFLNGCYEGYVGADGRCSNNIYHLKI